MAALGLTEVEIVVKNVGKSWLVTRGMHLDLGRGWNIDLETSMLQVNSWEQGREQSSERNPGGILTLRGCARDRALVKGSELDHMGREKE